MGLPGTSGSSVVTFAPPAPFPFEPRLLCRAGAANMMGVSERIFDAMVKAGTAPAAVRIYGRRLGWHSWELAVAVNRLAGLDDQPAEGKGWEIVT